MTLKKIPRSLEEMDFKRHQPEASNKVPECNENVDERLIIILRL